jgi:hypothetical protein
MDDDVVVCMRNVTLMDESNKQSEKRNFGLLEGTRYIHFIDIMSGIHSRDYMP